MREQGKSDQSGEKVQRIKEEKGGVIRAAAAGLAEEHICPVEKDKLSSYAL